MSSSQEKEEWTYPELGRFLAEQFKKNTLASFDSEELSWFRSSFTNTKKPTLLKEWILFNMFVMFQGISAHFKGSQEGCRILDQFHRSCSVIFTQAGVFEEPFTFIELLMSRYDVYSTALKKTRKPGPLYWVSKKFCQLCGGDSVTGTRLGVAAYYTHAAIACKTLIGNLLKSVRIGDRKIKQRRRKPNEWILLTHEAYGCATRGEYQKSIELAQRAIQLNPRASEAWRLIGNAYEFLGDEAEENSERRRATEFHTKATIAWNKAREVNPNITIPGYQK